MHLHARALHNCINWLRRSPAPLMCLRNVPSAVPARGGAYPCTSSSAGRDYHSELPRRRIGAGLASASAAGLPKSQRDVLEYLESETRRRASVAQQDLEPRFGSELKSIYWRLEALCCLGFTKKEVTNFRGIHRTYNYRLSDEVQVVAREAALKVGVREPPNNTLQPTVASALRPLRDFLATLVGRG